MGNRGSRQSDGSGWGIFFGVLFWAPICFRVKHQIAELLNGVKRNRKKSQVVKSTRKVTSFEELTICVRNDAEVIHARFVVSFFARVFPVEGISINIHHQSSPEHPERISSSFRKFGCKKSHMIHTSNTDTCKAVSPYRERQESFHFRAVSPRLTRGSSEQGDKCQDEILEVPGANFNGGVFFLCCELLLTGNKTKNEESDSS